MRLVSFTGQGRGLTGAVALAALLLAGCNGSGPGDDTETTSAPNEDRDGDGFTPAAGDCDDTDPAVNLAATEVCDGIDNDCDGAIDEVGDADGDGYLSAALCADGDDCDDADSGAHPGAAEGCDGRDNDCDGGTDEDFDGDGDGQASSQTCGSGTDCDDTDPAIYAGATELCDGDDNDCDDTVDEGFDQDGDGYLSQSLCADGDDCNDSNAAINPGAEEILDGLDNDCADGIEITNFDLSQSDFRANSPTGYTLIGHSISSVGDLNDDGFDDVLVGLPKRTSDPQYRGSAFLVFGRELGDTPTTMTMESAGLLLTGVDNGENAGLATTRAGDLNGDGYEDLVVAGPKAASGVLKNAGAIYILWGKPSGWSNGQALNTANVVIKGTYIGQEFGSDVAGVGDINGDGIDDLLVGAQSSQANPQISFGRAFLFLGRRSGWESLASAADADASFKGEDTSGAAATYTGAFVGAAGNVNGDAFDDMLIGAPNNNAGGANAGKTYIIFGTSSPSWGQDFDLARANVKLVGAAGDGAVAVGSVTLIPTGQGIGDVDKDGFDDIVITAPSSSGQTLANNGKAYVIFGRGSWTGTMTLAEAAGAIFYGAASGDQLGTDVAALGDVNGDGFDDWIVSAPGNDAGVVGSEGGTTYVILGQANRAEWASGGLFHADVSFLGGSTTKVGTGSSLAGPCDFNGDGHLDFVLASNDGTLFVVTDFAY